MNNLVECFGRNVRFTVHVPKRGEWGLTLVSNDTAILCIDNEEVINNDAHHSAIPKMATRQLREGPHDFHVRYYQEPRYQMALVLGWKSAGESEYGYIPRRFLERPHMRSTP